MITGKTRVVGIFGNPIEQTMSPYMHNAAFEALSLPWCYLPFNISHNDLEASVRSIIPLGIKGVNITIPFKMKVIPFLDELDRHAGLIGAVNTIEVREGRLIGHNTDGNGFIKAFNEEIDLPISGRRFLIIGAG
ncbi:MAG: shikimate dehydrogenase, partial [Nitrospirota bacterium]